MIPLFLKSNEYHNRGVRVIAPDFIGWGRSDKPLLTSVHSFCFFKCYVSSRDENKPITAVGYRQHLF